MHIPSVYLLLFGIEYVYSPIRTDFVESGLGVAVSLRSPLIAACQSIDRRIQAWVWPYNTGPLSLSYQMILSWTLSSVFVGAGTTGRNRLKFRSESAVLFVPASSPVGSPGTVTKTAFPLVEVVLSVIVLSVVFVSLSVSAAHEVVVSVTVALHNPAIATECWNRWYSLRIDTNLSYCRFLYRDWGTVHQSNSRYWSIMSS
jgi:hypothetical protein